MGATTFTLTSANITKIVQEYAGLYCYELTVEGVSTADIIVTSGLGVGEIHMAVIQNREATTNAPVYYTIDGTDKSKITLGNDTAGAISDKDIRMLVWFTK
jgi:hypothetical protein